MSVPSSSSINVFDELDLIVQQQISPKLSASKKRNNITVRQQSISSISGIDDPMTDWIPSIRTGKGSFTHQSTSRDAGHSSTYFGSNFSPMTSVTDDRDDTPSALAEPVEMQTLTPIPYQYGMGVDTSSSNDRFDFSLFTHTTAKQTNMTPQTKKNIVLDCFDQTTASPSEWRNGTSSGHDRGYDFDGSKLGTFGSSPLIFDDNTSLTSDSGEMSFGEPNTPSSVESNTASQSRLHSVAMSGSIELRSAKNQRGRKSLHEAATSVLTDWILEHQDDPYPTQAEKEALSRRGGVSVKQVVDWMTNMRKRRLHPVISGKRPPKSALDFMFLRNYRLKRDQEYSRQRDLHGGEEGREEGFGFSKSSKQYDSGLTEADRGFFDVVKSGDHIPTTHTPETVPSHRDGRGSHYVSHLDQFLANEARMTRGYSYHRSSVDGSYKN